MNGFERLNERDKKMDLPGIERSPKYPNALTSASVSQMAKHTHIRFYTRCRAGLNVRIPNGQAHSHPLLHTMQAKAQKKKFWPMQQIPVWVECGRRLKGPIHIINLYTVMKNACPHLPMYSG